MVMKKILVATTTAGALATVIVMVAITEAVAGMVIGVAMMLTVDMEEIESPGDMAEIASPGDMEEIESPGDMEENESPADIEEIEMVNVKATEMMHHDVVVVVVVEVGPKEEKVTGIAMAARVTTFLGALSASDVVKSRPDKHLDAGDILKMLSI